MIASIRQWPEIGKTIGWKRRHPGLELGLTAAVIFFVILSVAPAVSIAVLPTSSNLGNGQARAAPGVGGSDEQQPELRNVSEHGGNEDICFTAVCNDTAAMFLNNMDGRIDPCDNFYRYACGGYINTTKIPDDAGSINYYSSTKRKIQEQLRTIVEAEIQPNEPRAYRLVKKYYKSCMNESAIEARGVQPLLATLRKMGGWPMVEGASWNESNFDWTEAIYELRKTGQRFRDIINVEVAPNVLNSTENAIYISQPKLEFLDFRHSANFWSQIWTAYLHHIYDVAVILGAPPEDLAVYDETIDIVSFVLDLGAGISLPITPMTLAELKGNYSRIPWQEYIRKILPSTVLIDENQVVIVKNPGYFRELDNLLHTTSKRCLANYIAHSIALHSMEYLNKEMMKKQQKALSLLTGVTELPPRWKICVNRVSSLSFAIESMYVRQHFSADAKENAASMVDDIRTAIRQMLQTVNWLDQMTKSRALKKLDAMHAYIAYPDQFSDDKVDKIYEKLEIDEGNYYENVEKVSLFEADYSLGKLRQPVNRSDMFGELPIEVNAIYDRWKNVFALSAGILQGIFFREDRPRYTNYGAIGSIIGHEITHGFDDSGRHFNEKGEKYGWWQERSKSEYIIRIQCIVDQYSNYTVQETGGLKVKGLATLDENIADLGGMKASYLAYNSWVARNGEEAKLPGIDLTAKQLFWLSAANVECTKYTKNMLITTVDTAWHSPHEFRIIGPMSNLPEFAKDFGCPLGSKMNPREKCSVW